MRTLKDDKYKSILDAARKEFINKGFKNASMRSIAKYADVSLSNIYNYFLNKDEIFLVIVKPAKDNIFSFVAEQHMEKHIDINRISNFDYQEKVIELFIQLLEKYKEELCLLLYHSEGSSMRNFRDILTDHLTTVNNDHMVLIKKHYPHAHDISPFFIHTLSAFMVSIVGEIITHDLSKEKTQDFFREYFKFEIAGWRELIGL
ncbi:MAG: TetR/AcrR family transcriptional regulator [Prevotellaceae bacterium]|jgi:AcrR family transcriptional regulator|nr:TetR/AcrR family transcriptional regulator [Prevotellaceae bacterium]